MEGSGGKGSKGTLPPWTTGEEKGKGKGTSGTAPSSSQGKGKSSKEGKKGGKGSKGVPSLPSVEYDMKGERPWPMDGQGYRAQLEKGEAPRRRSPSPRFPRAPRGGRALSF